MTDLTPELTLFSDTLARFIAEEILPHYDSWEREGKIPKKLWSRLGELGYLAVDIPERYGGCEADFRYSLTVLEAFARANCAAFSTSMAVHSDVVAHYILNHGTEDQKQGYLPAMVSGDFVGAVAMTEPSAGSDLQAIRTIARQDGDDFIINGSKTFITNGQNCDFVVVAARTKIDVPGSRGISLFLVPTTTLGFHRGRNLEKIGLHAGDTSELFFDNVRVNKECILGELNQGFSVLMSELQRERLALASTAVAAAEGMLSQTVAYTKERIAFGQSIAQLQNTRFRLAEMATDIRVHRSFVEECKISFLKNELDAMTVSMAKLSATEMQGRVADGCLQLFGGYGYMREYGVSRAFVDARVQRIYGGTSEIMKEIIGRQIVS